MECGGAEPSALAPQPQGAAAAGPGSRPPVSAPGRVGLQSEGTETEADVGPAGTGSSSPWLPGADSAPLPVCLVRGDAPPTAGKVRLLGLTGAAARLPGREVVRSQLPSHAGCAFSIPASEQQRQRLTCDPRGQRSDRQVGSWPATLGPGGAGVPRACWQSPPKRKQLWGLFFLAASRRAATSHRRDQVSFHITGLTNW